MVGISVGFRLEFLPAIAFAYEYLLRKREGDSGQKFQPEPYRDANHEAGL
jgi:hypothetical protein